MPTNFNFKEQREQSAVKTNIALEYFKAWTKILGNISNNIAYIDLFAGPGIYENGVESTPILVLKEIISSEKLRETVMVILNEKDKKLYNQLVKNVNNLENISFLKHKPVITNNEITYDSWESLNLPAVPAFCFIDPSGYNGLSQKLFQSLGGNYGTDILFFFNFNDINRGLSNEKVLNNMKELYGEPRFYEIEQLIEGKSGTSRELIVVDEMKKSLQDIGFSNVLPFFFKAEGKNRTSHYIVFASKNNTALKIMKEIMWKYSEKDIYGVSKYGFIPTTDKGNGEQLSLIDLMENPYDKFKEYLCDHYAGRTISFDRLLKEDLRDTPYIERQYKQVLKELELDGRVVCVPSHKERRKNTLANNVRISFPVN